MKNISVRWQLIVGILFPLCIVCTIFALVEARLGREEALQRNDMYLRELTERFALQGDGELSIGSQIVIDLASVLSLGRLDDEQYLDDLLRKTLTANPIIIGSCIAFDRFAYRSDRELFAPYVYREKSDASLKSLDLGIQYRQLNQPDYIEWSWFRNPMETLKGSWSEPYHDKAADWVMCTYSAPFFRDGKCIGVATIDLSLERIRDRLEKVSKQDGVMCRLISNEGTFISAPLIGDEIMMTESIFSIAKKKNMPELDTVAREMVAGKSGLIRCRDFQTDKLVWLAYAPLPNIGWSLMAAIPESKIMAPLYTRALYSLAGFAVLFLLIASIIIVVSYRMTRPIKRLALVAGELAEGNLEVHVADTHRGDEIGQLAVAFGTMVERLKMNIERRISEEAARKSVEEELKIARRIQASLLPRTFPPFPDRKEFELHALNEPATFIAGDFFDFFFLDSDTLSLVIADVSGHGVPAAMFMAVSRTAIRNFSARGLTPAETMAHVNRVLNMDNDDMMFVTVFYAHYTVSTGRLVYVNAGHNPPYIVRREGTLEPLEATGLLLAAFDDASYTEQTVTLNPGDILATYTDGVTEAFADVKSELFGTERLEKLLLQTRTEPVKETCNRIYAAVDQHCQHEHHDDITLLMLKRHREC